MQTQRGKITLLEIVEIDANHIDHHLKSVHEKRKNLGSLRDAMRHATAVRLPCDCLAIDEDAGLASVPCHDRVTAAANLVRSSFP